MTETTDDVTCPKCGGEPVWDVTTASDDNDAGYRTGRAVAVRCRHSGPRESDEASALRAWVNRTKGE